MKTQSLPKLMMYAVLCCIVVLGFSLLSGCGGSDGAQGPAGPAGTNGTNANDTVAFTSDYSATIDSVTSAVSGTGVTFTINFTVKDASGAMITGLTNTTSSDGGKRLAYLRFALAKLTAGAAPGDSTHWTSYNQSERDGTRLTNNGDGTYTYVCKELDTAVIGYEANVLTRVGMQVSGTAIVASAKNVTFDFVPDGSTPAVASRDIVATSACAGCHGTGAGLAHGTRYETKYCVICHTAETSRNGHTVDFKSLIHEIHTSQTTSALDASEVTFPQDVRNCKTCHKGTDGDNYKNVPTMEACGSCHIAVDFATGASHSGGVQTSNANCVSCHSDTVIAFEHGTPYNTPNNPGVPAGLVNFTYVLSNVTVTANQPQFEFQILRDGVPVTFDAYSAPTNTLYPIAGFTSGPSFYVAFSRPQDGLAQLSDYNNNGSSALNASLVNIWDGSKGTLTGPDANGTYTALVTDASMSISNDAKMVTGAIIGTFTQTNGEAISGKDFNGDGDTLDTVNRQTPAVLRTATGYTARRTIVDNAKCNACHEQLGTDPYFHSGARNNVQVCEFCHTPNRTSSGWAANTKDFIHRLHAASVRTVNDIWHGMNYFEVTYPGVLKNCETCHVAGMYDFSSNAYTSTMLASMAWSNVATGTVSTMSGGVPSMSPYVSSTTNYGSGFSWTLSGGYVQAAGTTLVNSPISSACFGCHDSTAAVAHMTLNGGSIYEARTTALSKQESCLVCHGPGRTAAIADVHK